MQNEIKTSIDLLKFSKIIIFFVFALFIFCSFSFSKKEIMAENTNPNIILIVTDDQGYGDVGFNGCKDIPTPNIDKIAQNGVVFTQGYVSYCVCAPSRAGLLTGRYQDKFGFNRNPLFKPQDSTIGLATTEQLLPEFLQLHNYQTMAIGKWHLGAHEKFRPINRGFKEFFGFLGGGHNYFPEKLTIASDDLASNEGQSYKTKLTKNNTPVEESEYLTDAFSREAVSFIERNKQNPFFLYLAYNAPHTPLQATEKYLSRFAHITNEKRKTYAAMVSAVDDGIGNILNALDKNKIEKNTIVIFLSDNGGPMSDNGSYNGVLRGSKSSLFEGGIRVPFAMQWPAKIKANTVYNNPIISLDIFATVAASITSSQKTTNELDGVNLLPFITKKSKNYPHEYLFWKKYDQKDFAVLHQSGMKQIILKDSTTMLYNLQNDIRESKNIIATNSTIYDNLSEQRKKWDLNNIAPTFLGLNQEHLYPKK